MTAKPLYINGRHVASGNSHAVNNPWDGTRLADVCVADGPQVEEAVATAHAAFQSTRKMTADARAVILEKIALLIAERRADFVSTIIAEAGKPVAFAGAETERARLTFRFAAALALSDEGHGIAMDASAPGAGHFGMVKRFPMGVILGITLAILGVGMLVGTKYGRARWLLWLAIPLAFITCAARMKNGIDSNRKEFTDEASVCEMGISIIVPWLANDR